MALFINANKSVTLQGIKLHLFYTDDSVIHDDKLFTQNIFSVVQEFTYKYQYQGQKIWLSWDHGVKCRRKPQLGV
jgi:type I restriction enzyme R subunit